MVSVTLSVIFGQGKKCIIWAIVHFGQCVRVFAFFLFPEMTYLSLSIILNVSLSYVNDTFLNVYNNILLWHIWHIWRKGIISIRTQLFTVSYVSYVSLNSCFNFYTDFAEHSALQSSSQNATYLQTVVAPKSAKAQCEQMQYVINTPPACHLSIFSF